MLRQIEPGDVRSQLPAHPPAAPETLDAVVADLRDIVVPGILQWQHPRFFGYFPANTLVPVDPRRPRHRRPRRERDGLDHVAGRHRGRDADDGLDARAARPARALPQPEPDRRRRRSRARRARRRWSPCSPPATGPAHPPTARSPTSPHRRTPASRRTCASPGSATCASCPTTRRTRCVRRRSPR